MEIWSFWIFLSVKWEKETIDIETAHSSWRSCVLLKNCVSWYCWEMLRVFRACRNYPISIVFLFPNGGCGSLSYHFPFVGFSGAKLLLRSFLASIIPIFDFSPTLALTALVICTIKITQFVTVHAVQQKGRRDPDCFTAKRNCPQKIESTVRFIGQQIVWLEERILTKKWKSCGCENEKKLWKSSVRELLRDLQYTVGQELFAAKYDFIWVAAQALELEKEKSDPAAPKGVRYSIGIAQMIYASCPTSSSYRIGRKKFGRRYGDDFRELKEKSNLTVVFHHNDVSTQKIWEEHHFWNGPRNCQQYLETC